MHGNAFSLMAFDEAEEVLAEDLKDHADVCTVRALMAKMV
jgi:hypothetical protein